MPLRYAAVLNRSVLPEDTPADFAFRYVDISAVDTTGRVDLPDEETVFASAPSRARRLAPAGATVISTVRTYLRAIAQAPISETPLVFSTGFAIAEATAQLDPRFLYYACRSDGFVDEVVARSAGVSYPAINPTELGSIGVPCPAIDTQRRIADFLDDQVARIDNIIAARRNQIAFADLQRRSIQSDAVSGALRRTTKRHRLLGQVASDWPIRRLNDVVSRVGVGVVVNPSSYFVDDGVPFIHGGNVRDGSFDLSDVKQISQSDSALLWRSRLQRGDVVVVRAGYPGRAAVVPDYLDGANCASVLLIKPGAAALPHWIELFFNSPQGRAQVSLAQYGAAQEQINVGHVVDFVLPIPPTTEQQEAIDANATANAELTHLTNLASRQVGHLSEMKRSLITAAVTGEFDVSTADGSRVPA
jgi:type I restriction enzyme S subunit